MKYQLEFEVPAEDVCDFSKMLEEVLKSNVYNCKVKTSLSYTDVCDEIFEKLNGIQHCEVEYHYVGNETLVVIETPSKLCVGRAKRKASDPFCYEIGQALSLARAMKWINLEKALLKALKE